MFEVFKFFPCWREINVFLIMCNVAQQKLPYTGGNILQGTKGFERPRNEEEKANNKNQNKP